MDDGQSKGCGAPLELGQPQDLRLHLIAAGVFVVVIITLVVIALRTYVFPSPLEDIVFSAAQTRVDDSAGIVTLEIKRTRDANSKVTLRAVFIEGSAKAGEDYVGSGSELLIKPGQFNALLSIPLLPDKTFRKGERSFSVVLENVSGRPQHSVVIAPQVISINAQTQLDQTVLSASRIATDIAELVVKVETMKSMRNSAELQGIPQQIQEIRQQIDNFNENLVRAREAYRQAIDGLRTHPPQQVLAAIDRLTSDLKQRNFQQQSAVLPVMGRQYQELLNGKAVDMDRWVRELGQTVPREPDTDSSQSTKT